MNDSHAPESASTSGRAEGTAASAEVSPDPVADARVARHFGGLVALCLQSPGRLRGHFDRHSVGRLAAVIAGAMVAVGALLGAFSGGLQWLATPLKLALGTAAAMFLCLPSLIVFSNLSAAPLGLREALGSMLVAVAVLSLVLLALAPVGLVFSLSTHAVAVVAGVHIVFLLLAAKYGGRALAQLFRSGRAPSPSAAGAWMVLFVIVLLQLATTFRPIVGPYEPLQLADKRLFLQHWAHVLRK